MCGLGRSPSPSRSPPPSSCWHCSGATDGRCSSRSGQRRHLHRYRVPHRPCALLRRPCALRPAPLEPARGSGRQRLRLLGRRHTGCPGSPACPPGRHEPLANGRGTASRQWCPSLAGSSWPSSPVGAVARSPARGHRRSARLGVAAQRRAASGLIGGEQLACCRRGHACVPGAGTVMLHEKN